jgi:hypothetical protein
VGGGGREGEASKQADGAAAAAAVSPFFPPPLPLSPRAAGSLQKHGHDAHLPVKYIYLAPSPVPVGNSEFFFFLAACSVLFFLDNSGLLCWALFPDATVRVFFF